MTNKLFEAFKLAADKKDATMIQTLIRKILGHGIIR